MSGHSTATTTPHASAVFRSHAAHPTAAEMKIHGYACPSMDIEPIVWIAIEITMAAQPRMSISLSIAPVFISATYNSCGQARK